MPVEEEKIPTNLDDFQSQARAFVKRAKEHGKSNTAIANTIDYMFSLYALNAEEIEKDDIRETSWQDRDGDGIKETLVDDQTGEVISSFGANDNLDGFKNEEENFNAPIAGDGGLPGIDDGTLGTGDGLPTGSKYDDVVQQLKEDREGVTLQPPGEQGDIEASEINLTPEQSEEAAQGVRDMQKQPEPNELYLPMDRRGVKVTGVSDRPDMNRYWE